MLKAMEQSVGPREKALAASLFIRGAKPTVTTADIYEDWPNTERPAAKGAEV